MISPWKTEEHIIASCAQNETPDFTGVAYRLHIVKDTGVGRSRRKVSSEYLIPFVHKRDTLYEFPVMTAPSPNWIGTLGSWPEALTNLRGVVRSSS